jgi:hypothetical protein
LEAAASRALGEAVDEVVSVSAPVPDAAELNAQKEGLQRRLTNAEEGTKLAQAALRTGILDLLHECAQRAGEKYAQLAAELGDHWQTIYAVESFIGSLKNPIAPLNGWMNLKIPASEFLRGHKEAARREWNELLLESTDRRATNPQALRHEIADHGRSLFGEWPL